MHSHHHDERADASSVTHFVQQIQPQAVMAESKLFNKQHIDPAECEAVLTKILFLIYQGEKFSSRDTEDLFFRCSKLLQFPYLRVRRLVYAVLKDLDVSDGVAFMLTNTLNQDMAANDAVDPDMRRANAARVAGTLPLNPNMITDVLRSFEQLVVSDNPFVVASTLIAGLRLSRRSRSLTTRWPVKAAYDRGFRGDGHAVQLHALSLLYQQRAGDSGALRKFVFDACRQAAPRDPLAILFHVRVVGRFLLTTPVPDPDLLEYLNAALRERVPMVALEAARALCAIPSLQAKQLASAVAVLQDFLGGSGVHRLAAMRTLSELVVRFPALVVSCSADLERLLGDPQRAVAMMAVTALVRTATEDKVDRLLKTLASFMTEVGDELKVSLVEALQVLGLKFPAKAAAILTYLHSTLREEGGFRFKRAAVTCMLALISAAAATVAAAAASGSAAVGAAASGTVVADPATVARAGECRDLGLDLLAEYIEDCDFAELSVRILCRLAELGPAASNPAKYIRFIFNRAILEVAVIRAAAVAALARFAVTVPALAESVRVLLRRVLSDHDDEVRDRAVFYLAALQDPAAAKLVLETPAVAPPVSGTGAAPVTAPATTAPSAEDIEHSLRLYLESDAPAVEGFSLQRHFAPAPLDPALAAAAAAANAAAAASCSSSTSAAGTATSPVAGAAAAGGLLSPLGSPVAAGSLTSAPGYPPVVFPADMPDMGALWWSSAAVPLTESEAECTVQLRKHVFPRHVLLHFTVKNNLRKYSVQDVQVVLPELAPGWTPFFTIPEPFVAAGATGSCFLALERAPHSFRMPATGCRLRLRLTDEDGTDDEEDYQLEALDIREGDFIRVPPQGCGLVAFKRAWAELSEASERVCKFSLSLGAAGGLQAFVDTVFARLGLRPAEGGTQVAPGEVTFATNMHGTFLGDVPVFARAGFMADVSGSTLNAKVAVRCADPAVAELFATAFRSQ